MQFATLLLTVPSISILLDDNGTNPVAGQNYSLSCKISGIDSSIANLTYKWKKDDTPLSEIGPFLSFSPLRLSDAGWYSCTVNMYECPFKRSKNLSKIEGTLYIVHAGIEKALFNLLS